MGYSPKGCKESYVTEPLSTCTVFLNIINALLLHLDLWLFQQLLSKEDEDSGDLSSLRTTARDAG